jgi:monoamine oxidase
MSFLFTPRRLPAVWWTTRLENSTLLTGWIGGPRAPALEGRSAGELGQKACTVLAEVFQMSESEVRAQLVTTHIHDWSHDPFACGAYSYIPAGAMDAPMAMVRPELDTLYFAGEHTDVTAHWGTVHAAMRSGLRAAAQIMGEA